MDIGAFIIGDEILSGKRQDKHLAKLIELLAARGLRLSWARYLGDERERLVEHFRQSLASQDLVFSCGGIGATPDDHTRQAVAQALGLPLQLHPEAARLIAERTADMAREGRGSSDMSTPENQLRLRMGEFPAGSAIIPNPFNKIPGFRIGHHHFLPGFPVMAWPMIEQILDGQYAHLFARDRLAEQSFIVYELPESAATPVMEDVEARWPAIKTFSLPSVAGEGGRRLIELGVKGPVDTVPAAFACLLEGITAVLSAHAAQLGPVQALRRF